MYSMYSLHELAQFLALRPLDSRSRGLGRSLGIHPNPAQENKAQ